MPPFSGPYLAVAAIVRDYHVDADKGVLSLNEISSGLLGLLPTGAPSGTPFRLQGMYLFVRLIPARFPGTRTLRISSPSLGLNNEVKVCAFIRELPEETPLDVVTPLDLTVHGFGLHWIDLSLDSEFLSRVPLRIVPA